MSQEEKYKIDLREAVWVLGMGAQGGFLVAIPVLVGLGIGVLLDRQFGTMPWITIILTLIGGIAGPAMLYRWVKTSVARQVEKRLEEKRKGEEKPE
jgi:F0F1-type ATP synthase assembly protein I